MPFSFPSWKKTAKPLCVSSRRPSPLTLLSPRPLIPDKTSYGAGTEWTGFVAIWVIPSHLRWYSLRTFLFPLFDGPYILTPVPTPLTPGRSAHQSPISWSQGLFYFSLILPRSRPGSFSFFLLRSPHCQDIRDTALSGFVLPRRISS